jgi:hypothetical protein
MNDNELICFCCRLFLASSTSSVSCWVPLAGAENCPDGDIT